MRRWIIVPTAVAMCALLGFLIVWSNHILGVVMGAGIGFVIAIIVLVFPHHPPTFGH